MCGVCVGVHVCACVLVCVYMFVHVCAEGDDRAVWCVSVVCAVQTVTTPHGRMVIPPQHCSGSSSVWRLLQCSFPPSAGAGKKKGVLLKRKKDRDTWAPRLFELDGETLRYYVKVCC